VVVIGRDAGTNSGDVIMKDHEIALLVNELVSVCEMFHDTQQLRQHIANVVNKAVKGPHSLDTSRELWNAFVKEINPVIVEQQSQFKMIGAINKDLQRLMDKVSVMEQKNENRLEVCETAMNELTADVIVINNRFNVAEQRIDTDLVETRRSADDHHQRLVILEIANRANA
jgi:hypothetical protein